MIRKFVAAATVAMAVGAASLALADGVAPRQTKKQAEAAAIEKAATPAAFGQTGDIAVPGGDIRLAVPANYYFLSAAEARAHLQRIGAPAPDGEVIGMVAPANTRPIDDNFWGAVISTNPLGHVAEERAERFAAPDFIEEVRAARPASAPKLESFASPPVHDRSRRLTAWTERVAGSGSARTIRNEQRLLGRNTVAGVTIDGRADQQAAIAAAAPEFARMISFPAGKTYADFTPAADAPPLYDLPSLLTQKAKPANVGVAASAAPGPASGSPAKGLPAKSQGLQPVGETASAGDAPPPTFSASDLQQWLPWIGGGLIALAVIPWLVGMARKGRGGGATEGGDKPARRPSPLRSGSIFRPRSPPPAPDPNLTPSE